MKCNTTLTQLAILAAATSAVAWFPASWSAPSEPVLVNAPVYFDTQVLADAGTLVDPTVERQGSPLVLIAQDGPPGCEYISPSNVAEDDDCDVLALVIENVQSFYESVEDFHADFTQEFANLTLGTTQTSTGHVYFKTPGLMRWDYQLPTQRFMMRDGENLWIYEPEEGQYYTQAMDESDLPTALRFLMGEGNLTDDFTVTLDDDSTDAQVVLRLVPIDPAGEYTHLEFVVDATTWHVTETVIYDPIGNANRLTFTGSEINSGLPDSGFQFTPPEGATQIQTPN